MHGCSETQHLFTQISLLHCGCSFLEPCFVLYDCRLCAATPSSTLSPLVHQACIPPTPPLALHPKTMCGMSLPLPPRRRRAPNKTKQLSLSSLGPGLHPLPLSNSPLSPAGPSLHFSPFCRSVCDNKLS